MSEKPTSVAETLRRARAVIEDPQHWTKHAMAKRTTKARNSVSVDSPEAGAWCAVGAIRLIDGPHVGDALRVLTEAITGAWPSAVPLWANEITDFNDTRYRRHDQVLAAFDQAIALAEQRAVAP